MIKLPLGSPVLPQSPFSRQYQHSHKKCRARGSIFFSS